MILSFVANTASLVSLSAQVQWIELSKGLQLWIEGWRDCTRFLFGWLSVIGLNFDSNNRDIICISIITFSPFLRKTVLEEFNNENLFVKIFIYCAFLSLFGLLGLGFYYKLFHQNNITFYNFMFFVIFLNLNNLWMIHSQDKKSSEMINLETREYFVSILSTYCCVGLVIISDLALR